ncbi:hypothetical protein ACS0TY_011066 [Phlomoides rotata]
MYLTLAGDTYWALPPMVSASCFLRVWTALTLGYYLSWSLFSLSHHVMEWMAACLVGFDHKLKDYALLGDDIKGPVDLSPVSVRSIFQARSVIGLRSIRSKYGVSPKCLLRLAGAGYRVIAKLDLPYGARSASWDRLISLVTKPPYEDSLDFEWWLCGDKPLDPYIRYQLFSILVDWFRP